MYGVLIFHDDALVRDTHDVRTDSWGCVEIALSDSSDSSSLLSSLGGHSGSPTSLLKFRYSDLRASQHWLVRHS